MATERIAVNTSVATRLSWGAIFGGTFVALGVWALLYLLGAAIGLTTIDRGDSLRSILTPSIGTGLWSLITPIIALFIGGLVAARTAGVVDRMSGALHGAVIWGLTTVLGVVLMVWALGMLAGAAMGVGRTAVGAAGSAVSGAAQGGPQAAQALGINVNDLLAPVNQQLAQQGAPPVTANQLQAALQDAANTAVRQGRMDRELLVNSIAQNTNLSRQDAQQVAARIEQQLNQAGVQVGQLGQQVQQGAVAAAETTATALWFLFFSQLLSLAAAILGASIGVSKRQRVQANRAVAPTVGTRGEVYP